MKSSTQAFRPQHTTRPQAVRFSESPRWLTIHPNPTRSCTDPPIPLLFPSATHPFTYNQLLQSVWQASIFQFLECLVIVVNVIAKLPTAYFDSDIIISITLKPQPTSLQVSKQIVFSSQRDFTVAMFWFWHTTDNQIASFSKQIISKSKQSGNHQRDFLAFIETSLFSSPDLLASLFISLPSFGLFSSPYLSFSFPCLSLPL